MPELKWNEYDFIECLGVLPEIGEYETEYIYTIAQNNLKLEVRIWQYESIVQLTLFQDEIENYITSFCLAVRGQVRFVNDKRGSYLEFQQCVVVPSRFYYVNMTSVFDETKYPDSVDFELNIYPQFHLKFF